MNGTSTETNRARRGHSPRKSVVLFALCAAGFMHNGAAAQVPSGVPDYPGQVMLIKNTVTAVNHGNITGNYTVLRDLACEQFRQRNSSADLSNTFANLRQQRLDLSPILVCQPQLTQRPACDPSGRLKLAGYFPTRPKAVNFELIFRQVNGGWMIEDVTLGVAPFETVVQSQRQPHSEPSPRGPSPTAQRPDGNPRQPSPYR